MPRLASCNPWPTVAMAASLLLLGCSEPRRDSVNYERALEISRKTAQEHGYDLTRCKLDTFGDPAAVEDRWLVVYLTEPGQSYICDFMIVVDRQTGNAELQLGE